MLDRLGTAGPKGVAVNMIRPGLDMVDITAIRSLRTRLDRRVLQSRCLLMSGAAGQIGLAAAAAWAVSGIVPRLATAVGLPLEIDPLRRLVVPAVVIAMTWWTASRLARQWPSRLTVTLAAEANDHRLGERISSAIDFLDDPLSACGDGTAARPNEEGSPLLRQLAVLAAAEASESIARVPLPDAGRHLLLTVAGLAAVATALTGGRIPGTSPATDRQTAPTGAVESGPSAADLARQTAAVWQRIELLRSRLDPAASSPLDEATMRTIGELADEASRAAAVAPKGGAAVLVGFAEGLGALAADLQEPGTVKEGDGTVSLRVCRSLDSLLSLARAAAGIADAAVFERQLAGLAAEWFPLTAGERTANLPAADRDRLLRTALSEDDCMLAFTHDRRILSSGAGLLADVSKQLEPVEARARATADAIRSNQLALAAQLAGDQAASLERAGSILGVEPFPEAARSGLRPAGGTTTAERGSGLLERLASGTRSVRASEPEAIESPNDSRTDGVATMAGPGGTAPLTVDREIEAEPTTDRVGRLWSLLPPTGFPERPPAGESRAFPSHRTAIDAYYLSLFESLGRPPANRTIEP